MEQPDLFSQSQVDQLTAAAQSLERAAPPEDDTDVCPCCKRPFLSDTGKVSSRHPETAKKAAKMPGKRSQAVALLGVLARIGPMNVGRAAAHMNKSPNQMATRMLELREAGLAERVTDPMTGEVIQASTPMGGVGELHRATPAGIRYLERLAGL